jgi:hypothetical protein
MGAPDGAAAGLEGVVDPLIGLGFLGHLGGLHCVASSLTLFSAVAFSI